MKTRNYLFHVTTLARLPGIMQYGLIPRIDYFTGVPGMWQACVVNLCREEDVGLVGFFIGFMRSFENGIIIKVPFHDDYEQVENRTGTRWFWSFSTIPASEIIAVYDFESWVGEYQKAHFGTAILEVD